MDLWVTRHNYRAPRPYWGFWQFNSSNGESLAESADAAEVIHGLPVEKMSLASAFRAVSFQAFLLVLRNLLEQLSMKTSEKGKVQATRSETYMIVNEI